MEGVWQVLVQQLRSFERAGKEHQVLLGKGRALLDSYGLTNGREKEVTLGVRLGELQLHQRLCLRSFGDRRQRRW